MNTQRQPRHVTIWVGVALGVAFAAGYIQFAPSPSYHHWDSLSYSHSAETHGIVIWGNHPLGHMVLNSAFVFARALGHSGPALEFFQTANSLIGGLVVTIFFAILVDRLAVATLPAIGAAIAFGGTYGFWHVAGTADIYTISLFLSILGWWALIRGSHAVGRSVDVLPAVFLALATLAHQMNAVLVISGAYLLFRIGGNTRSSARRSLAFLAATGVGVILGYGVMGWIATSSTSISEIVSWARGYVGDARWGGSIRLSSLGDGWTTATGVVVTAVWESDSKQVLRQFLIALFLLAPVVGIMRQTRWEPQRRALFEAVLIQFGISLCLILWWEPRHPRFWLMTLVPYVIAIGCCWGGVRGLAKSAGVGGVVSVDRTPSVCPWRRTALKLLCFGLGIAIVGFNLSNRIISESVIDEPMERALNAWTKHSGHGDILIPTDELVPHLLFRAGRSETINIDALVVPQPDSEDPFGQLRDAIVNARCDGHRVLVASDAGAGFLDWRSDVFRISLEQLKSFFAGFERQEVFRYANPASLEPVIVHRLDVDSQIECR